MVGICNGFQVLTEAGLLPGALQKNRGLRFLCTTVEVRVDSARLGPHRGRAGRHRAAASRSTTSRATTPATPATLAELRDEDRVVLRYVDNPNGSVDDIAGVCNAGRNVVGLMPHPERASDALLGSVDGSVLLGALLRSADAAAPPPEPRCRSRRLSGAARAAGRRAGPRRGRAVQLRVRGIFACCSTEALTPTVRQAE